MQSPARVNPVAVHPAERRTVLSGAWRFRLDPDDRGATEGWPLRPDVIEDPIEVPGTWQGQGFGHDGSDLVWDFRLECRTLKATYRGTGWYAHAGRPPAAWGGQRIWLCFGGAHPSTEVWLNGVLLGHHGLPFVPFAYEVTDQVRLDADNALVVRVHEENRELGFAYGWQGNWSGLYRQVEWRATGATGIAGCRIHADLGRGEVRVAAELDQVRPAAVQYRVAVRAAEGQAVVAAAEGTTADARLSCAVPVPGPAPWGPDSPRLYRVDLEVLQDGAVTDAWCERVGFVELSTRGKQVCINGQPHYLRGTGDFVSCPETGCPDWDRDRWRRRLRALRAYGYNYVRLQSYVYGPEYYDVADEVGLLVQSEMGMLGGWGGHTPWHVYAWPPPTPAYRELLRRQWNLVVERDASHPSANLYCMSNELGDSTHFPRIAARCAAETRQRKPTALILYTDGGLNESLPQDIVNAEAGRDADTARPVIQHEFRWWSSLPDVRLMPLYRGAVRPYAAEMAQAAASKHGIGHLLVEAAEASQRLQLVEAKGQMEACRRDHPHLAGICHFNAMDAGPSPQGVITEFYDPKQASAAQWLETNGDTVVLSSLGFDDRVLLGGDSVAVELSVSDFSHPPLQAPVLTWELVCAGHPTATGRLSRAHEPFRTCGWGRVEASAPAVERPTRARFEAALEEQGRAFRNGWWLWLLPSAQLVLPEGVALAGPPRCTWLRTVDGLPTADPAGASAPLLLAERLDERLLAYLRRGGRAILAAAEGLVRPFNPKFGHRFGHYYFTPPANYPPYEDGHDGILVRPHPLLGELPHEGFADLQLFRPIAPAPPLDLEPLGLNDREPVIRPMHSYPVGRSLGYLVEGAVGAGRLVICALELDQAWPEARYLLAAMARYLVADGLGATAPYSDHALREIASGTDI